MFKTATIFLIADHGTRVALASLHQIITEPTAADPDATQWSRAGFAQPDYFGESAVFVGADTSQVFVVQQRERVLPGKVIRTKMIEKANEIATRQGYKAGRKQMAEIKEEVVAALLPSSHVKPLDILCMISGEYLFIGTGSARMVDLALNTLRSAFPEERLNFKHIAANRRVTPWMMNLLVGEEVDEFTCGESVVLKGRNKSAARFKDMELATKAVQDSVEDGFQPVEIAVKWMDRIHFSMTDQMIVKRIKFSDILLKDAEADAQEGGVVDLFDSTVALVAGELKNLLADLRNQMPETSEDDEL